jgi:hypothetical protein
LFGGIINLNCAEIGRERSSLAGTVIDNNFVHEMTILLFGKIESECPAPTVVPLSIDPPCGELLRGP